MYIPKSHALSCGGAHSSENATNITYMTVLFIS